MTESAPQRASDVDQPDGGGPSRDAEGSGRTPHPDQPAEGAEDAVPEDGAGTGSDPADPVTGG
jgi:hypothetical protein